MRRKENEAGSGLSCESDLPRSPARSHGPILREGAEPHAGDGHHRAQDIAGVEKKYPPESGRPCRAVEVSRLGKLLESIRNNPLDVRFDDACMVAVSFGFEKKGGKGSHVVFARKDTKDILNSLG